jgi:hypothetical protein
MRKPLLLLFIAAASCLPRTTGELNNGGFTYFCASDDDLACRDDRSGASDIPPAIAVGAHFDLDFSPPLLSTGTPAVTRIQPASPDILVAESSLDPDTTGFRFKAPGTVAVLAKSGAEVVDFVHVTGANIDHVSIVDGLGNEAMAVSIASASFGETLKALPRDAESHTLAGALAYSWSSSDESVVSVSEGFRSNEVDLIPNGPGKATITVKVLDRQASIEVTVGGAP